MATRAGGTPRWMANSRSGTSSKRPVLHPWEEFSGYQTKHYPTWERLQQDLADKYLVMPTEYLHGLFDGGHGAGLEDYWNAITSRPNGVGGFLWVLADEGIERTDRNREIDNWGTNAPDGIVGPRHEKEASYLTAKDIFCPVQIAMKRLPGDFDGKIPVRNRYDFRNLSGVEFEWRLSGFNPSSGKFVLPGRRKPRWRGARSFGGARRNRNLCRFPCLGIGRITACLNFTRRTRKETNCGIGPGRCRGMKRSCHPRKSSRVPR